MRRLTFTERAQSDLAGIQAYIADDSPTSARLFVQKLKSACTAPLQFAEIGRVGRRRGTRELTTVWPYVIVYRVKSETISIERIIHGARRR